MPKSPVLKLKDMLGMDIFPEDKRYWKIAFYSFSALSTGLILWMVKNYWSPTPKYLKKKNKSIRKRSLHELNSCEWENVGKVKNLWIYPIKSCAGLNVEEALMDKLGARFGQLRDRSLMIIDSKYQMITGRKFPQTVLITSIFHKDSIILKFPHLQPLKICLSTVETNGDIVVSKIWRDTIQGLDCGDEAADWLKLALGVPCRLLFHGTLTPFRKMPEKSEYPLIHNADTFLYADGFPYMLMTEASVNDLQKRLSIETFPQNFRPNIYVEGTQPYDEDDWSYLRIGNAIFRNVKPCDRCTFPSVNYKTAQKDKNLEPLRTLKKYRLLEGHDAPFFGINLCSDISGKVKVGDIVYVLRD